MERDRDSHIHVYNIYVLKYRYRLNIGWAYTLTIAHVQCMLGSILLYHLVNRHEPLAPGAEWVLAKMWTLTVAQPSCQGEQ